MSQRTATITSLPMAFEIVKAMQADGLDWSEGYRPLGRQALQEIIEQQMAAAVDRHLDQLTNADAADRRNGMTLNFATQVATEPKRYQVSFLDREPDAKLVKELKSLAAESEEFAANGREFYAWHPEGVARSKLWNKLAGKGLGVTATARNWTTVTTLLEMADE